MAISEQETVSQSDWIENFSRLSQSRRQKTLDRAVRLVADSQANANEREMSLLQVQAALKVDPDLVLDVLASVRGNQTSNADIEKLKQDAISAQLNFDALVRATQTLRFSLSEIGAIKNDERLPETVEEWKVAIKNVVAREARQLAAKEDYLLEQKQKMEGRRTEILDEIKAASDHLQDKTSLLTRLSNGLFAPLKSRITDANQTVSTLSFEFDHIEAPEVGQLVRGEGIFQGYWTPRHKNGKPIGIECELYAAQEDLRHAPSVDGLKTGLDTVRGIAGLKKWHDHDGGNFANDAAIVKFLDETAKSFLKSHPDVKKSGEWFRPDGIGKWFAPPREILYGKDSKGDVVREENLYALRDTGAFKGTFTTARGSDFAPWYWSSTEHRDAPACLWIADFSDGNDDWDLKVTYRLSCRPCRVGRVRHLTI